MSKGNVFGIISEGPTDFAVLKNMLYGLFSSKDENIDDRIKPLHPVPKEIGGWLKVFRYCKTEEFKGAFSSYDYIVIQVDTDVSHLPHYDIPRVDNPLDMANLVKEKIINEYIGVDFYEEVKDKIFFAICVDCLECWLLPFYHSSDDRMAGHTRNCLHHLGPAVRKERKFKDINLSDGKPKDSKVYHAISEVCANYSRHSKFLTCFEKNPSLKMFYDALTKQDAIIIEPIVEEW